MGGGCDEGVLMVVLSGGGCCGEYVVLDVSQ